MQPKILIIGATGFIGHHLFQYFLDLGYDVFGTYRRTIPKINCERFTQCDLAKEIKLQQKFDIVFHFASQVEVNDINSYIDNTILCSRNVINFCEKTGVRKLIFASSISVYGECSGYVNEESDKTNLNNYGLAKLIVEEMIRVSKIPQCTILRLSRILGAGVEYTQPWLPKLVSILLQNESVTYYNAQLPYNNMVYITDLLDFCKTLLPIEEKFLCITLGGKSCLLIEDIVCHLKEGLHSTSILIKKETNQKNTCYAIDITKALSYGFTPMDSYEVLNKFIFDSKKIWRL